MCIKSTQRNIQKSMHRHTLAHTRKHTHIYKKKRIRYADSFSLRNLNGLWNCVIPMHFLGHENKNKVDLIGHKNIWKMKPTTCSPFFTRSNLTLLKPSLQPEGLILIIFHNIKVLLANPLYRQRPFQYVYWLWGECLGFVSNCLEDIRLISTDYVQQSSVQNAMTSNELKHGPIK